MPGYRYTPKEFLDQPGLYGRRDDAAWDEKQVRAAERSHVAAAYFQHLAACTVLAKAQHAGHSLEVMAGRVGSTEDTLRRKLYGESPARLDEILAWALAYGIDVLPEPDDVDQLLP